MPVNIRQIETFRAVMAMGSMSAAAQTLHVTQPAVSQTISALEKQCGFRLFERRNGRLFATHEASILLGEVERTYSGLARIDRIVAGLREQTWGTLRIAAFPALVRRLLPRIIAGYCRARPDVSVLLDTEHTRNLADLVARREVDLALSTLPSDREDVEATLILTADAVCVLPADHRLAGRTKVHAAEMEGERFISLGHSDRSRFAVDKVFETLGVNRVLQIASTQSEAALTLVGDGCGVAVIDPFSAFEHHHPHIVILPFEPAVPFKLWLLQPGHASLRPRLVQDFGFHLQSTIVDLLPVSWTPR